MIKRLVSFALHQPLFVFLLTGLFLLGGIVAFENLPIEAFPDVTDIQVTVITLYPGYAAEEVEKQVTTPLEIGLSGLPNAVRMFSHTQFGLSFLIVTFDDRADDYQARQLVLERLRDVDLPSQAQVQLAPLSTPIGELFRYRVTGNGQDLRELRSIQDWTITRYLKLAPGVADVVSLGGFPEGVPGQSGSGQTQGQQRFHAAGLHRAGAGKCERRRQLPGARRSAVSDPRDRSAALCLRTSAISFWRSTAGLPCWCAMSPPSMSARFRGRARWDERRQRNRHRHRAHAQRRESVGGAEGDQGAGQGSERHHSSQGRIDCSVLRPDVPDRHDAAHRVQESAGGRGPGDDRAVPVPGEPARRRHRRVGDPTGAALHLHGSPNPGSSRESAFARRHGLRDHRGRRGDRSRKYLPRALRASAHGNQQDPRQRQGRDYRGRGARGTADHVLDADHHHRPHPDLHVAAARGAHLRAHGLHHRVGAARLAVVFADAGPGDGVLSAAPRRAARRESPGPVVQEAVSSGADASRAMADRWCWRGR